VSIFRRLARECLAFPGWLLVAVASLLVLSAAQLYLTWLIKLWAEGLLAGEAGMTRSLLTSGVALTGVVVGTVFLSRYALNSVNQRMVERLRNAAHERILALSIPAGRRFHSGDLVSRLFTDIGILSGFVRDVLKRLVGEGLLIFGAVAMLFYLHWRLALATCVLLPAGASLLAALGRVIRRKSVRAQQAIGDLTAILNEQLHGLSTIKTFQAEAFEGSRFRSRNSLYRRQMMRGEWWSGLLATCLWLVTGFGLLAIVAYGSGLVVAGEITSGGLVAFCLYVVQTVEPLRRLGDVHALLQRAIAAATRVYEVIDCPGVERGEDGAAPITVRGELCFDRVRFRYRPEETVLEGLDLQIGRGRPVALVGASGAGKSTLASLLGRFCEVEQGRILLDGTDLRSLSLPALRRIVCVVAQEPFIFSGSLRENLRYGSWQARPSLVHQAVQLGGLSGLVASLPEGLATALEEGGRSLSVGQKQRISLARAIVRDPAVLVLDEATSALDGDTEAEIFTRLAGWLALRTVIVISHRLSTIRRFDRILVLEGGRVVGDGTLQELVRGCPAFRRLFADQLESMWGPEGEPSTEETYPARRLGGGTRSVVSR
jgi:subfamily B ATP-binding cassette protein MsbA